MCGVLPSAGATCTESCDEDSYCAFGSGSATGTCIARQANGATCADNLECTSNYCAILGTATMGTCGDEPACT
jgi:hypothetical protein